MTHPLTPTLLLFAVWLLTNCWLVPLVQAGWKKGDFAAKVQNAGKLAVLETLRGVAPVSWTVYV